LAFAVYYGLPEAWTAMPEVESESGLVNKAYEGVIEYINEYVPPTVKKVENNPVNLT
jgi:hypothetical protein